MGDRFSGRAGRVFKASALFAVLAFASSPVLGQMGGGMGGGGCCGGGSSVIDPPVGAAFTNPVNAVNVSTSPGVVEYNLEAKIAPININGTTANLMTYNGYFPGPLIKFKRGSILKINLKNSLPYTTEKNMLGFTKNQTNLHTHGLHTSPEAPSDYVMYSLGPGETYNHQYETQYQAPGSYTFYHPHRHGLVAEQYWAGLVGPMIIEDETPALASYSTQVMVLKDISLSGNSPAPHSMMMDWMQGKEGSTIMVNGQVNPRITIRNGQVQRWRILNASNARFYRLSLDGHPLYVVGTDGGLLDKPYAVSEVLLSPGERIDVLVKFNRGSGNYKFKSLPYSRMGMMTSPTITMLTVTYKSSMTAQNLPTVINSNAVKLDPAKLNIVGQRELTLSMMMGRGYINGMDFDVDPFMMMSTVNTYEVWTIYNNSNMDHPFHQHINAAQVLSISGGDTAYRNLYTQTPAWKDVVIVPKMGSVKILVPIMDYTGMAMFHCHILEHEDIGMMGHWHIMDMPMMGM